MAYSATKRKMYPPHLLKQLKIPLKKIQKEQELRHRFHIARDYYFKGNYPLCVDELNKLHKRVNTFENSREILSLCIQAIEVVAENQANEALKRKREEVEFNINKVVTRCAGRVKTFKIDADLTLCLKDAINLNPDHPKYKPLYRIVESNMSAARTKQYTERKRRQRMNALKNLYSKAKSEHNTGPGYDRSISSYKRVLESSAPDPYKLKQKAKRKIALIKRTVKRKISSYINECKKQFNHNAHSAGIRACKKASALDPNNTAPKKITRKHKQKLTIKFRPMYQEAIVQESVGEIKSALKLWKNIKNGDMPGNTYHTKAKIKLKSYEGLE